MRLPRRVLTPEFIAAWREYEYQNRKAAAHYALRTAPPTTNARNKPRPPSRPCPRCGKNTRATTTECRACVRGRKP